jgi:hypothetical protein
MNPVLGTFVMTLSLALVGVAVWVVRPRAGLTASVVTMVVAGAGLGLGALLCIDDVDTTSWVLTPIVVAGLTVAHTTAMFAGEGPLRT